MSRGTWGPWIEWVQGPRPIGKGFLVQAEMGFVGSKDYVGPVMSEDFDWNFPGDPVARYRIKKPKGLTKLIRLAENLPAPSKVKETTT